MIIYNVTIKITKEAHDDWLNWMKTVHVPDVINTGLFVDASIRKLLYVEKDDGITYSIQYRLTEMDKLHEYQEKYAKALQADHTERYKDQFVAFRTLMTEEQQF